MFFCFDWIVVMLFLFFVCWKLFIVDIEFLFVIILIIIYDWCLFLEERDGDSICKEYGVFVNNYWLLVLIMGECLKVVGGRRFCLLLFNWGWLLYLFIFWFGFLMFM